MKRELVEMKLQTLNTIVFRIALLEWAGNAVGILAFLWATAVLLGGFCSLLNGKDFWYSTIVIFVEGSRVFIRNDALVNQQWLFGSTNAFRWGNLSSPRRLKPQETWKLVYAMATGVGIGLFPLYMPLEIIGLLVKVPFLVIISHLLTKQSRGPVATTALFILGYLALLVGMVGAEFVAQNIVVSDLKVIGFLISWLLSGTLLLVLLIVCCVAVPLLGLKVSILSGLACFPFLQAIMGPSYYKFVSIPASIVLLALGYFEFWGGAEAILEKRDNTNSYIYSLLLQIIDIIMPIFVCWSLIFPFPGISLKISFYMLFSVIATVLTANLQIPIAFVQVLLSILRLCSLLGHHHHDYNHPLPPDASPNLVPSIVVFLVLELCQGSSYILATILWLISLFRRRSLLIDLGFEEEWGEKAINLYCRQAYQARTEKGLFHPGNERYAPNLKSFAIQSLGCTTSSHEMQIVGLRMLDNYMQRADSKSRKKLITETVKDAKNIITSITGIISYFIDEENCGESHEEKEKEVDEQKEVVSLCLQFVRRLAINGGRFSTRFRQELSENPFFLDSLEQILNLEGCQLELWEPVMGILAMLALDEGARQEIGVTQSIIRKLMHAFVRPDDVNPNNGHSLQMAAGTALVNLTIMNTDNCWAILLADPHHNLLKKLIHMLEGEDYICVAANLLHNLCANSIDKLMDIDFGANVHLETALQKVMQIIKTKEGKKLEAALGVVSGYREYFAQMLGSESDASAAELIEKLVDTLKSNRKPCPEYPRIRRVIIEVVISIMESCPQYKKIFREKGAEDALDMVKGTPSRLEKYRVFLDGEGVVAESVPMRDLVDKAKRLIDL